jgi:hypothetical protein
VRAKPGLRLFIAILLAAVVLASCGQSAQANGEEACKLVHRSLVLYRASNPATVNGRSERQEAMRLLRQALPYASIAAGANGAWRPLKYTLGETSQVGEGKLVTALKAQCSPAGENQGEYLPS